MTALIRILIASSCWMALPALANTTAEPAPAAKNAMTKNSKGVVPALLPDIADPSTVHAGEGDALHLQPSRPPETDGEDGTAAAVEKQVPVAKKAIAAKPEIQTPSPGTETAVENRSEDEMVALNPREQVEKFAGALLPELPIEPEVAVILSAKRFFPARIRLKEGQSTRLLFTSLNPRPAALVIEQLQVQRWIASEKGQSAGLGRVPAEILREIGNNRMTEILLQPQRGTYTFHDALSGAVGEIVVE